MTSSKDGRHEGRGLSSHCAGRCLLAVVLMADHRIKQQLISTTMTDDYGTITLG